MNKIKLKGVRYKNLRSFLNLDLGELPSSGLISIQGDSGAGKTNLHIGIEYGLGYCPYPATELQSWLTDEPLQVELDLEINGKNVLLKRGEEFSLNINGAEVQGSVKNVEKSLQELLAIPIDLLDVLTFREQQSPGRLLSMTDSQKKEFLSQLLGLQELEPRIDEAVKAANAAEKRINELQAIIDTLQGQIIEPLKPELKLNDEKFNQIPKLEEELLDKTVNSKHLLAELTKLKSKVDEINNRIKELSYFVNKSDELTKLGSEISALEDQIYEQKEIDFSIKSKIQEDIDFEKRSLPLINKEVNKKSFYVSTLDKINKEIEGLLNKKCPTCSQEWIDNTDKLKNLQHDKVATELQLKASLFAEELLKTTNDKIDILHKQLLNYKNGTLEDLLAKKVALTQEYNTFRLNNELKARKLLDEEKKVLEDKINPLLKQYNDLKTKISDINLTIAHYRAEREDAKKMFLTFEARYDKECKLYYNSLENIEKHKTELKYYKNKFSEESDFAALVKGYLGAIVNEVLIEIAHEANETLKHIPNVSSVTLEFVTENTTQKGTVKQEIKPIIYKNGHKLGIKSGLSGGQRSAVHLATDLALGTIIGRRTGVMPGFLIIDEGFDGLGVKDKEACLELLKYASKDRLIFLIDHSTETKDYFDKVFYVKSDGTTSTIALENDT